MKGYGAVCDNQAHATHRSRSPASPAACSNKSVSSRAAIPAMLASITGRPSREPERVTVRVTCGGAAAAGTTGSWESPTRRDSQSDACSRPDTVSARSQPTGLHIMVHAFAGGEPLGDQGIEPDQHLGVDFRLRGKPDGFGFEDSMDQDRIHGGSGKAWQPSKQHVAP